MHSSTVGVVLSGRNVNHSPITTVHGSLAYAYTVLLLLTLIHVDHSWTSYMFLYAYHQDEPEFNTMREDLGIDAHDLATEVTIWHSIYALFYLIGGRVADIYDRRSILAVALFLGNVACIGVGMSQNLTHLIIFGIVRTVSEALVLPASVSLVAAYFPPAKRAAASGLFFAAIYIGMGLASLTMIVDDWLGWRRTFWLAGCVGLALMVFFAFFREPLREGDLLREPVDHSLLYDAEKPTTLIDNTSLLSAEHKNLASVADSSSDSEDEMNGMFIFREDTIPITIADTDGLSDTTSAPSIHNIGGSGRSTMDNIMPVTSKKSVAGHRRRLNHCRVLRQPILRLLFLLCLIRVVAQTVKFHLFPAFFAHYYPDHEIPLDAMQAVIIGVGGSFSCYAGGRVADRWSSGEWKLFNRSGSHCMPLVIAMGTFLALPFLAVALFVSNIYVAIGALFFDLIFSECWLSICMAILQNALHVDSVGQGVGLMEAIMSVSGVLTAFGFGYIDMAASRLLGHLPLLTEVLAVSYVVTILCSVRLSIVLKHHVDRRLARKKSTQTQAHSKEPVLVLGKQDQEDCLRGSGYGNAY